MRRLLPLAPLLLAGLAFGQDRGADPVAALGRAVSATAEGQLQLSENLGALAGDYGAYGQKAWLQARQDESDTLVGGLRAASQDFQGDKPDASRAVADLQTVLKAMDDLRDKLKAASADGLPSDEDDDGRRCTARRAPCAQNFTSRVSALAEREATLRESLGSAAVAAAAVRKTAAQSKGGSTTDGSSTGSSGATDAGSGSDTDQNDPGQGGSGRRRAGSGGQTPPPAAGTGTTDSGSSNTSTHHLHAGTMDWKPATVGADGSLSCPANHHPCQSGYNVWCEDMGEACAAPPANCPQYDPCNPDQCNGKYAPPMSACSKFLDSDNKPGYSCTSACNGHACPSPQTCVDQNDGAWGCSSGTGTCKSPKPYLCYYGPPLNRNGCSETPCPGSGVCSQPSDCPLVGGQYQLCIAGRCVPQDACHTPSGDPCCPDPNNCNSVCHLGGGAAGRYCEMCDPNQCTPLDGIAPKCGEGSKPGKDNCGHPGCTVPPPTSLSCVDACTKWVPTETQTSCGQMIKGHYIHADGTACKTERPESRPGLRCCFTADCQGPTPACGTYGSGTYRPGCFTSGQSCQLFGGPCSAGTGSNPGGCVPPDTATQTNTYDACVAGQCGSTVGTALLNPASCLQMCECTANPCACARHRAAGPH